ncbi:hypothetical protein [Effusibacillus dendaii]|uniref:Uncharacterized protein n=1 Tax=Effusibacillus dendaii TaxID=2743772 RepID=A0A7I8DB45_9BACL|nr:hypothetical protein [Effusibacillus dendaii]BCJ86572.1 hypothetical protein skT53_15570 [Effusibacillus dendaii]
MSAVLRQHCMRYVGQRVIAHHVDGRLYHGILHSVTHDGIYIRPLPGTGARRATFENTDAAIEYADNSESTSVDAAPVWGALFFIPFAFLTGLVAGAAAWSWWW